MNRSTLIRAGMKVGAFNVVGRSKGRFQFQSLCAREDRGEKYRWRCVFPGRTCETAAAICNLQKSERFCRSVNGRANWKTSVRRLPVTGARSARLRSLPFCRPTTDFSLPAFRLTSPRPFLFNFVLRNEFSRPPSKPRPKSISSLRYLVLSLDKGEVFLFEAVSLVIR